MIVDLDGLDITSVSLPGCPFMPKQGPRSLILDKVPVCLWTGSGSTGSVPLTGSTSSDSDRFEFQVPGWVPLFPGDPRKPNMSSKFHFFMTGSTVHYTETLTPSSISFLKAHRLVRVSDFLKWFQSDFFKNRLKLECFRVLQLFIYKNQKIC